MKYLLLFLLFFTIALTASGNAIDKLKTDNDVLRFMLRVDTNFSVRGAPLITIVPTGKLLKLLRCNDVARAWAVKSWEKVDFNHDALTDLLVIVKRYSDFNLYAIIDKGDHTFKLLSLTQGHGIDSCQMAKPVMVKKKQMLLFYSRMIRLHRDNGKVDVDDKPRTDTLIYKYGDFVEYNPKPDHYQISYVTVKTKGCYGECPLFTLYISSDGKAVYQARSYNEVEGNFKGNISADRLKEIISLVNYVKIKKLRDDYRVAWTDDAGVILKVGFKNGTVKEINDYGMIGTHGLSRLYDLFYELRTSEKWNRVK